MDALTRARNYFKNRVSASYSTDANARNIWKKCLCIFGSFVCFGVLTHTQNILKIVSVQATVLTQTRQIFWKSVRASIGGVLAHHAKDKASHMLGSASSMFGKMTHKEEIKHESAKEE